MTAKIHLREDIYPKELDVPTSPRRRRNRAKSEPSAALQADKVGARQRALKRPLSPGVMFEPIGQQGYVLTSPHSDLGLWELQLADAFGTRSSSVMKTFLGQLQRLVPEVWDESAGRYKPHETELNAALAMVADVQPRNVTEAALAAQMVAIHLLSMKVTARAIRDDYDNRMAATAGKLARTFAMQMDALRAGRTRNTTARQSIKVRKELHQHVHYHDDRGGRTIGGQPHGRAARAADQCAALPSPQSGGEAMPLPCDEGQEPVQAPRR